MDGNRITRADQLRTFNDEELALWFAKTQCLWAKEIYSEFGVHYEASEDVIKTIADELLLWLQEAPAQSGLNN